MDRHSEETKDVPASAPATYRDRPGRLFLRFLRFGLLAWGGPVPQIAMLRQELVEEEGWVSRERFNRALGVYQALPGPEAHELCVWLGMTMGGRVGGFLAGLGFMLPGFVLMFLLSWLYLAFGQSLPLAGRAAFGVQAAVGALLVRAIHRLGSHALKDRALLAIAGLAGAAELASVHFLPTLLVAGGVYALASRGRTRTAWALAGALLAWAAVLLVLSPGPDAVPIPPAGEVSGAPGAASLGGLAWSGLKSGLLTFGGAYTVIPFLQHDAVEVHAWMTTSQFLDGLALSSIIPAPLIIFSTFVGYLGAGPAGALVMTAAIFLPAFGFTLLGHGLVERLIERRGLHAFLDGVTAGVIGLMAVTTLRLLRAGVHGPAGLALFAAGLAVLYAWRSKLAVPVVVLAAGAVGLLSAALS